jgi:acyl-CoA synthetase (AMP-forming)/AMP-acid ligase II
MAGLTGDVGTIDADGFITLIDTQDMIISGGENVIRRKSRMRSEHPAVANAVFGAFRTTSSEIRRLCAPGGAADEAALIEHCAKLLARFKRPRSVKFVDDFPKTPIGKIQKNMLREPYWKNQEKKI